MAEDDGAQPVVLWYPGSPVWLPLDFISTLQETPRFCISGLHMAALFLRGVAGGGGGGGGVEAVAADRVFTGICTDKGTPVPPAASRSSETIAPHRTPASTLTLARLPFSSGVFTVLLFSTLVCEGVWGFDSGD